MINEKLLQEKLLKKSILENQLLKAHIHDNDYVVRMLIYELHILKNEIKELQNG